VSGITVEPKGHKGEKERSPSDSRCVTPVSDPACHRIASCTFCVRCARATRCAHAACSCIRTRLCAWAITGTPTIRSLLSRSPTSPGPACQHIPSLFFGVQIRTPSPWHHCAGRNTQHPVGEVTSLIAYAAARECPLYTRLCPSAHPTIVLGSADSDCGP
jgi:hypothetical protein